MNMEIPPVHEQWKFLEGTDHLCQNVVSLFSDEFTFVRVLANLLIEQENDLGIPVTLPIKLIEDKFYAEYWRRAASYSKNHTRSLGLEPVLHRPVCFPSVVGERSIFGIDFECGTPVRRSSAFIAAQLSLIENAMLHWRFQNVLSSELMDFLFDGRGNDDVVTLRSYIPYCLRNLWRSIRISPDAMRRSMSRPRSKSPRRRSKPPTAASGSRGPRSSPSTPPGAPSRASPRDERR
jgi:hypothetical protein